MYTVLNDWMVACVHECGRSLDTYIYISGCIMNPNCFKHIDTLHYNLKMTRYYILISLIPELYSDPICCFVTSGVSHFYWGSSRCCCRKGSIGNLYAWTIEDLLAFRMFKEFGRYVVIIRPGQKYHYGLSIFWIVMCLFFWEENL